MRHGLSELNIKGLYAGSTDSSLVDEGREQARQAGQTAKSLSIDLIVSSPLSRALETAQIVAKEIGYTPEKIVIDNRITERYFGRLEAQPYAKTHTDEFRLKHGAETQESLLKRTEQFLEWLEAQPADNILVVSHGSTGRALRSLVKEDFPFSHPHQLGNAKLYQWL